MKVFVFVLALSCSNAAPQGIDFAFQCNISISDILKYNMNVNYNLCCFNCNYFYQQHQQLRVGLNPEHQLLALDPTQQLLAPDSTQQLLVQDSIQQLLAQDPTQQLKVDLVPEQQLLAQDQTSVLYSLIFMYI